MVRPQGVPPRIPATRPMRRGRTLPSHEPKGGAPQRRSRAQPRAAQMLSLLQRAPTPDHVGTRSPESAPFPAASTAQAAEAARHLHSVIATRTECTGLIKGLETAVRQSYRDEGADLVNSQLTKRSYTSSSDTFRQFPIDEAKNQPSDRFRQFSIDDTSKPVYILVDSRKFKIYEIPITSMKSLASLSLSLIKSLP